MAEIKWFLDVPTARSAALLQCICGGANCNFISVYSKYCFGYSDTSLSVMCGFSVNLHFLHFLCIFVILFSMQSPVLF